MTSYISTMEVLVVFKGYTYAVLYLFCLMFTLFFMQSIFMHVGNKYEEIIVQKVLMRETFQALKYIWKLVRSWSYDFLY